jgi:TatD DNase family protein
VGESAAGGWFDSHCHVQEHYEPAAGDALARARSAGVTGVVCVGTDAVTSAEAVALARSARAGELAGDVPEIWATAGLHPHEASQGTSDVARFVADTLEAADGALVAIGECGLDYFYEHSPRPAQRQAFAEQIGMAQRHGLTLVIHARDAWDDLFSVLASEGVPERTILHCFTGGPDEAERCLAAGLFVSFSGIVTFKNADALRAAALLCPSDRLLVETDSPFLAPVPHRGTTNEPGFVSLVGAAVAKIRGVEPAELARSSAAAARRAFAI